MKQVKILVIEDTLAVFTLVRAMLMAAPERGEYEYTIISAFDSLSGIEQVWLSEPDIILLDIELPELNGYEVLQILRSLDIPTPVVVMTANHEPGARQRAFQAGCNAYLVKPFLAPALHAALRDLLEGESSALGEVTESVARDIPGAARSLSQLERRSVLDELIGSWPGWWQSAGATVALASRQK